MTPNMFVGAAMVFMTIAFALISVYLHLKTKGMAGTGWAIISVITFLFTVSHLAEMVTYE